MLQQYYAFIHFGNRKLSFRQFSTIFETNANSKIFIILFKKNLKNSIKSKVVRYN